MSMAASLAGRLVDHASSFQGPIGSGTSHRPVRPDPPFTLARVFPELAGDLERVDAGSFPPGSFIAGAMHRPVMDAAKWHREFIAGLAAECPRLHVPEMMGIGWLAPADQASNPICLGGYLIFEKQPYVK